MKKLSVILVVLIWLLVGCGNVTNTSTNSTDTMGYIFEAKGTAIVMNTEVAPILKSLGDAMDYFEAQSCAFQGMDKIYTYNGFELHTYEVDGVDYVSSVIFLDDSVSTKEGIYLFSSKDDVLATYGDKYSENLGLFTYELDESKISFIIDENDQVTSIEYMAIIK